MNTKHAIIIAARRRIAAAKAAGAGQQRRRAEPTHPWSEAAAASKRARTST